METFNYNDVPVEVVEWSETIWCGKIGYAVNNTDEPDVDPILSGFMALDTATMNERLEPDPDSLHRYLERYLLTTSSSNVTSKLGISHRSLHYWEDAGILHSTRGENDYKFYKDHMVDCDFRYTTLERSRFTQTSFKGCALTHCDLRGMTIDGIDVEAALCLFRDKEKSIKGDG